MKVLIVAALMLLGFAASSQALQPALLYGKKENRLLAIHLLGLPKDTASIAASPEDLTVFPWVAVKSGVLYIWNTEAKKWQAHTGSGSSGSSTQLVNNYESFAGTSANEYTLSKAPIAASISVFINGQKIPKEFCSLTVNTVFVSAALAGFTTDTNDKVEIYFQTNQ